jgi:hypothetical protein
MEIILFWLIGAFIVGAIGSAKTIGFGGAFLLSLFLSPLLGFIIVLFYPSKESQQRSLEQQQMQTQILQSMAASQSSATSTHQHSIADEIQKLKSLHDAGAITEQEFETQKQKLLGQ